MKHITNLENENITNIINIINNRRLESYIKIIKDNLEAQIEFEYAGLVFLEGNRLRKEPGKVFILCKETLIEIVEKYYLALYYDEEESYINIRINNYINLIVTGITKEILEEIVSDNFKISYLTDVNKDNVLYERDTIQEKIYRAIECSWGRDEQYTKKSLVRKRRIFTLRQVDSVIDRIFGIGINNYITKLRNNDLKIVTIIIDNVKIKVTNMVLDRTMPMGLIYPEFKNEEFKIKSENETGMSLINLDFYNYVNVNFLYEHKIGQLAIIFNDTFIIDIFNVKSKEFLKLVNLNLTMDEEAELRREDEGYYLEYQIDENDPNYEFSEAEAIDNWLGK